MRVTRVSCWGYADAFARNCPGVRMTKDEREELGRLFRVCADEARQHYAETLAEKKDGM